MQSQRQLPYVQILNPPLKFLIDTGANQSFICPEAVEKFYNDFPLNFDPFEVTNVHTTTRNNYSINLPCFNEFQESGDIKLFIYKFHDFFDGLIGLDLLEKWEAKIDLKDKELITRNSNNPIRMYNSRNVNFYEDVIPANSTKLLKIPINTQDGDAFINDQIISNCTINCCLTSVRNGRGFIEVTNHTAHDLIFCMDRAVQAETYTIQCTRTESMTSREREVLSR